MSEQILEQRRKFAPTKISGRYSAFINGRPIDHQMTLYVNGSRMSARTEGGVLACMREILGGQMPALPQCWHVETDLEPSYATLARWMVDAMERRQARGVAGIV